MKKLIDRLSRCDNVLGLEQEGNAVPHGLLASTLEECVSLSKEALDALYTKSQRVDELEKSLHNWRQDAAARLFTYRCYFGHGITLTDSYLRVNFIMPTLAALTDDMTKQFTIHCEHTDTMIPVDDIDVDSEIEKAQKSLDYGDD